jgi:hypothetical protein
LVRINFKKNKYVVGEAYLKWPRLTLIAYSGNLNNGFTDFGSYSKSLFGKLNGFAVDLGFNYQLKTQMVIKWTLGIC